MSKSLACVCEREKEREREGKKERKRLMSRDADGWEIVSTNSML